MKTPAQLLSAMIAMPKPAMPQPERSNRRIEWNFHSQRGRLLELPPSAASQTLLLCCSALVVASLGWSWFGRLDVVATGNGTVEPLLHTKTVQPLQTSIVSQIMVANGDHVRQNQPLLLLNDAPDRADAGKADADALQAELDVARLHALRRAVETGTPPVLHDAPPGLATTVLDATLARMDDQYRQQQAKLADLDQQAAEKMAEMRETAAQIAQGQALLPYLTHEQAIRDKSVALGVGNKIDQIEITLRATEQREGIKVLTAHLQQAAATIGSLHQQRDEAVREYDHGNWDDLEKAETVLDQARDDAAKAREHIRDQVLRAPIDGTVQQLTVTTAGGVVSAAQPVLSVVPDDARVVATIMLPNQEVGFVHPGQHADVKVEAFSYTRYGTVPGTVLDVSRDAIVQDHNRPATGDAGSDAESGSSRDGHAGDAADATHDGYMARIRLDRSTVMTESGLRPLGPGMQVSADILTGRRRVLSYLIQPADRSLHDAMRER